MLLQRSCFPCNNQHTHPCSPSSCTLSQRFKINSQFSSVRFSSVVLSASYRINDGYPCRFVHDAEYSLTISSYGFGWPLLNIVLVGWSLVVKGRQMQSSCARDESKRRCPTAQTELYLSGHNTNHRNKNAPLAASSSRTWIHISRRWYHVSKE